MGAYQELRVLVCNRILDLYQDDINFIFALPKLLQLYLNVNSRLASTSVSPADDEIAFLRSYYQHLVLISKENRIPPNLLIYIQGVQVDLTKPFAAYGFHQKLITHRFFNEIADGLDLQPFYSVFGVDLKDVFNLRFELQKLNRRVASTTIYQRFNQRYPFIQIVRWDCSDDRNQPDLTEICCFLRNCSGLTELDLCGPAFFNDEFCKQLASEFPCCRTLRCLKLFSPFRTRRRPLNFRFLDKLKHVRVFQTNLASLAKEMFLQVKKMRTGQRYRFRFQTELGFYQDFDFQKIDESQHAALARRWSDHQQAYQELAHLKETSFERLYDLFVGGELKQYGQNCWI